MNAQKMSTYLVLDLVEGEKDNLLAEVHFNTSLVAINITEQHC
jgi:hypothetical protein